MEAIKSMRMGEKSKITLQPKYGFRKVKNENFNKYINMSQIKIKNDSNNDEFIFDKMKKTPIIYEITLIDFLQLYDISGHRNMMKFILSRGEGILKPCEENDIIFNFKLTISDVIIFEKVNENILLDKSNFNKSEIILFKSLKKNEKANIEILNSYFQNLLFENQGYICKNINDSGIIINLEKTNRIIIEVELFKFKQNTTKVHFKNIEYKIKTLNKGLGHECPWINSLLYLSTSIYVNNELFYSDNSNYTGEELIQKLKDEKLKIKLMINKSSHDKDKSIKNEIEREILHKTLNVDGIVHDPILENFPNVIFKEIIPKMKLLETISVTFNDKLDYLKIDSKEILNEAETKEYKIVIILLNFLERTSIFNKTLTEELQLQKIFEYKTKANFYFSNNLLRKAKRINTYLVDEYVKFVNLERGVNKLTHNKKDFEDIQLLEIEPTSITQEEIKKEMRKITSNLILILYKLKKYKKCENYIRKFFIVFDSEQKDEKILFLKYKVVTEGFQIYENSKILIKNLIDIFPNSINIEEYRKESEFINKKISGNLKQKNAFVKKMFNFD